MAETLPFIREGLLADERCIFVTDECAADSWAAALRGYGVDVEQETTRGSLDIWPMSQWRTL
ncbi:MAG TPA: MEDS domain-containing protein, partial [Rubrobacter sp.]|nr:MEDS domain-containing protein [Rubrobacter sp.]